MVVAFSGASASPSRCTSTRRLASAFHHASTFRCAPLVRLVVTLPGASTLPSRRDSARCRLSSLLSCLVGLSHYPAPQPIVQMVVVLPLVTVSCAPTPLLHDSVRHRLPLLPSSYPSLTTSPSPERERGLPEHCRFRCHHGRVHCQRGASPAIAVIMPAGLKRGSHSSRGASG